MLQSLRKHWLPVSGIILSLAVLWNLGTVQQAISQGIATVKVLSGTLAATQSGTWNINNISGTVSLPTGAATAANQDGIIRDGTGDTTQANVSGGNLHTEVGVFPDNEPFNVAQFGGSAVATGTGASGVGVPRVTVANDSSMIGTLAEDGAAAGANRFGTLPSIAESGYNGSTVGRNTALRTLDKTGALMAWAGPDMSLESYSASAVIASAASATDIAILPGNATTTVLVTEVRVSCTQTTAGVIQLHLIKRSTANSGGTSSGTEVPDDANYSAADSAVLFYTANPTPGSAVGDIDTIKLGCMATSTATPNDIYIANFRQKPIVLRGTGQGLAVNLNGVTVSGGSFTITYKWIEASGL